MIAIKAWSLIMTFYIEKTKHLVHTVLCVMHIKVCSEYCIWVIPNQFNQSFHMIVSESDEAGFV